MHDTHNKSDKKAAKKLIKIARKIQNYIQKKKFFMQKKVRKLFKKI